MMSEMNLTAALPEIFLAIAGMLLLMLGVFRGNGGTRLVLWLTVGSFVVVFVMVAGMMAVSYTHLTLPTN